MHDTENYSLHLMENIQRAKVDEDYLGRLIMENGGLIIFTIEKYVGSLKLITSTHQVEVDDLLQVGRIAFINAIRKFDCDKGVLFTSYVPTAIIRDVRHYLRDNCMDLKLPRPINTLYNRIKYYLSNIHYEESKINFDDIATALGESVEDVKKAWLLGTTFRLDNPITLNQDTNITYLDALVDKNINIEDNVIEEIYLEELLNEVQSKLSDLEKNIMFDRLQGHKQSDIAKEYDISQMKVSRILKKVRNIIECKITK